MDSLWIGAVSTVALSVAGSVAYAVLAKTLGTDTFRQGMCRWKAARIKSHKGHGIGVLVCDLQDDKSGKLSKLVRQNIRENYTTGAPNDRGAVNVIRFPLSLPAVDDDFQRNEKIARRWLEEANCDVIIWGEKFEESGQVVIKVMGKYANATMPQDIVIKLGSATFAPVVASAITREVIEIETRAFAETTNMSIESLKKVADTTDFLLSSDLPGFDTEAARRIRLSVDRLQLAICKRAFSIKDCDRAVLNAQKLLDLYDEQLEPREWSLAASKLCGHIRRRCMPGWKNGRLLEAFDLSLKAMSLLQASGANQEDIDLLTVENAWLNAIHKRDRGEFLVNPETNSSLEVLRRTKVPETKALAHSFILAHDPHILASSPNMGDITKGWMTKSLRDVDFEVMDDFLLMFVVASIVEEQAAIGAAYEDEDLIVEVLSWLASWQKFDVKAPSSLALSAMWMYLDVASLALRQEGITFFRKHFKELKIDEELEALVDRLKTNAVVFSDAPAFKMVMLTKAGGGCAAIAAYNKQAVYFSMAEEFYKSAQAICREFSPYHERYLVFERCSSLNNWTVATSNPDYAERAIKLMNGQAPGKTDFDSYVLAFAYLASAKATIITHNGNINGLLFASVKSSAHASLNWCKKSMMLPETRGERGRKTTQDLMMEAQALVRQCEAGTQSV